MGTGYAADMGVNLSFPVALKPTFSFSWRDIGITKFTADAEGGEAPDRIDQEMLRLESR